MDSWNSKDNVWLWGDGIALGQNPQNLTWSLVSVAGIANAFQIKHQSTGRFLCASTDGWIRVVSTVNGPSRNLSQWIMSNDLPGPALPQDVFYLINVGNGQFFDGAHYFLCSCSCRHMNSILTIHNCRQPKTWRRTFAEPQILGGWSQHWLGSSVHSMEDHASSQASGSLDHWHFWSQWLRKKQSCLATPANAWWNHCALYG